MCRRKGDCMNIDNKTSLENNKDEWESFEEKEFSLDFFKISNKIALFIIIIFLSIVFFAAFYS